MKTVYSNELEKQVTLPTITEDAILGFFEDYRFLSNFHVCNVTIEGITYPSSEHAYMAMKSNDAEIRKQFASILSPAEAKKFGRTITLRDDWDNIRIQMMYDVLLAKFTQNLDVKEKLLATGTKRLEETNYWNDTFWGVCEGVGENNLGKALMAVREELRK